MTTPSLLGVLAGCSVVRVVARLSSSSLEMNGAREPCSERKFQSHPTVPPGRLNELAFAAVYREWGVRCELLWGVEPHDIPNGEQQGSRMREHGPPPPDRRVGVHQAGSPGCPGRACSRKGDLEGVSLRESNQGEAGLSCGVRRLQDGVKGLVEAVVQEELQPGSPRSVRSNSGSLRFRVLLGLCNHWPFLGGGCRSSPSGD